MILAGIRFEPDSPLYIQLYDYMKEQIVLGVWEVSIRLPSVRQCADTLGISTTPVEMAYQQLVAEGFVEARNRSGYHVLPLPEDYARLGTRTWNYSSADTPALKSFVPNPLRPQREYTYDFHLSRNDFSRFPHTQWRRVTAEVMQQSPDVLFYGDPQGELGLRKEICTYLEHFRGVRTNPDHIVIAADQMTLLVFLAMLLQDRYSVIGLENPGYPLIAAAFRRMGYQLERIPLEPDGLDVSRLLASEATLVAVTPSHQYPQGMVMSVSKRLQLLEWAQQQQGYIIEDDYDGEFRYHGRPIPSLQGWMESSRVIYMGGFSQIMAPALSLHYMVLPPELMEAFRALQYELLFEQSASRIHQCAMELFMKRGYLEQHIRKMRKVYRRKHDILVEAIKQHFAGWGEVIGQNAGFHIVLRVHTEHTEAELLQVARMAGIHVASSAYTWHGTGHQERREFIIGFASMDEERIEEGIVQLSQVWGRLRVHS